MSFWFICLFLINRLLSFLNYYIYLLYIPSFVLVMLGPISLRECASLIELWRRCILYDSKFDFYFNLSKMTMYTTYIYFWILDFKLFLDECFVNVVDFNRHLAECIVNLCSASFKLRFCLYSCWDLQNLLNLMTMIVVQQWIFVFIVPRYMKL